jgi:hypothetical protein
VTVVRHTSLLRGLGRIWTRGRFRRAPVEVIDASWHVDTEAICPDCLQWIAPADYVRRNAFDLLEHEVCPPAFVVRERRT